MTLHGALIARLEAAAEALTERVLIEMYANPFWLERFGERARHGRTDGRYHVQYLVEALRADSANVIEQYARWLQQVLTTRGMCTRHLDDNFARLGVAIADTLVDAQPAVALLDAARAALRYPSGPPRELQDRAEAVAGAAAAALYAAHPDWLARWGEAGRARCVDDLVYHLHYAADALALGTPTLFTSHVRWIGGFLERRGIPRAHLDESLAALRMEVARALPGVDALPAI